MARIKRSFKTYPNLRLNETNTALVKRCIKMDGNVAKKRIYAGKKLRKTVYECIRRTNKRKGSLCMVIGSHYIPKFNLSKPRGEDAHFFSEEAQVIGVADGIGSWAKKGIDSGEYARTLMENVANAACNADEYPILDVKQVLEIGHFQTEAEGTSTACVVSLAGDVLRGVNLGDSGFMVIRDGKMVYKSAAQQSRFNHPYQVGRRRGNLWMAEEIEVKVEAGDVVVVATDGLFDNVFLEDIEEAVRVWLEMVELPEELARALAQVAREKSLEVEVPSPFELMAYEAGVPHFGGKYDDVTVVCAYICCP